MEQDSVSFSVQMRAQDLYRFKIYHVYHGFSGVFGIFLTVLAAVMLVTNFKNMVEQSRIVFLLIVVWFIIIDPLRFWLHSKGQIKQNKVYHKPLQYRIDEAGITVSQNETTQTMSWENLVKLIETKKQFIVYSSKIHAFIFPKEAVGTECDLLRKIMLSYTMDKNVKIKGFIKDKTKETEDVYGI